MDLLAIGETMLVVVADDGGPLTLDAGYRVGPAGAESNVAVGVAQLGLEAAWASRLGADPIGDLLVEGIGGHGVDLGAVERLATHPTGIYFKNPGSSTAKVVYYRAGSAASTMDAGFARALAPLRPRLVHVSGITAALSDPCRGLLDAVLRERVFGDATVAFDVNHRLPLWSAEQAAGPLADYAELADVVLVGRDEAEALWGTPTPDDVRERLPRVRHLVVKDADVEAVEFESAGLGRDVRTSVPTPPVDVVEPVGAGDAFAAGWEAALLSGADARGRLAAGHATAAAVLRVPGDLADDLSAVRAMLA
jgi:2-dehydro-3-deoxygluconokinase